MQRIGLEFEDGNKGSLFAIQEESRACSNPRDFNLALQEPFFENFGAICAFAFGGTLISALFIGVFMQVLQHSRVLKQRFANTGIKIATLFVQPNTACRFGVGQLHVAHQMPFMVCLCFGAIISATDPVTVLAVFQVFSGSICLIRSKVPLLCSGVRLAERCTGAGS